MRPLALLVLAEFLVVVLLAGLWLGGAPSAAHEAGSAPSTPPPGADVSTGLADARPPAPAPAPIERQEAVPTVPDVVAGDPLGILVTGTIRSADGTPVEGASVAFRRDPDYRNGDSAVAGVYAAVGLLPGVWKVTCRADGFANHESTVTLDARAFQQVDIELKPSWVVRVKVVGADGKSILEQLNQPFSQGLPYVVATEAPLAGDLPPTEHTRLLRFGLGEWFGYFDAGRQTDPKLRDQGWCGELRLNQAPPVSAALLLRTTLLQIQRIEPGQKELVFIIEVGDVLAKLATVKLRLLDGVTGEPIVGAVVRLSTAQGGGSSGKAGDDGRVVIEHALPGLGSLQVQAKDREGMFRHVRVPSGGIVDMGDITLTARVKVTGVVVDVSGKPANGASVQWTELDCRTFPQPLTNRRSASADAEGRFELPCGRHRYVVLARTQDGGFGHATVDASGGAPPPATITLSTPTRVALHADFDTTKGYMVTALAGDGSPVAVATLGADYRPDAMSLPPGSYTIEITDMKDDRLVRSFPLQVGSVPLGIDVP